MAKKNFQYYDILTTFFEGMLQKHILFNKLINKLNNLSGRGFNYSIMN